MDNNIQLLSNESLLLEIRRRLGSDNKEMTEFDKLENELRTTSRLVRDSEKPKSTFLSNVRNEINNPLTSILGLSESIVKISSEEKVKKLASLIHQQAFDLDFQMRNIIIASEIETGDIKPMVSQVNIGSLINSLVDYFKIKISQANVNIEVQACTKLVFQTDSYLLQIICSNLLANAIEYCGKNKWVLVKASEEQNELLISVADYGLGIAQEKQNLLFRRFTQLDAGTTKLHAGQGLGLAIVHGLVGILNGSVKLDSSDNTGTSITIKIPLPEDYPILTSMYGNEVMFGNDIEF